MHNMGRVRLSSLINLNIFVDSTIDEVPVKAWLG